MAYRLRERKVEEDAATGELGPDFNLARPLWNSEVSIILEHTLNQRQSDAQNNPTLAANSSSQAQQIIQETLNYVRSLNNFPNKESIDSAHDLLNKYPISEFELALINNLRIDDSEELISLLPTVKNKLEKNEITQEQVEQLLNDLKRYQTP